MEYTISEASKMFNIKPSTIRYYESIGLIPKIKKKWNKNFR